MSSEDREAQEDELLALAGIYDEDEFKRAESSQGGEFRICLTLPPKFRVLVDGRNEQVIYMVDFLPPVVLKFELPVDYPSASAPTFTLQCKWLSETQLTSLCTHLDEIWEENRGCVVLFSWMQFLKDEVLSFLNISSSLLLKPAEIRRGYHQPLTSEEAEQTSFVEAQDTVGPSFCDPRAIQDVEAWTNILPEILDFNHHQKQKKFNSTIYSCKICFLEKLGSDCLCFNKCEHVYCNNCLREYFEIQIKDGMVQSLICPEPKCHSVATPAQVTSSVLHLLRQSCSFFIQTCLHSYMGTKSIVAAAVLADLIMNSQAFKR
ncbi:E3 ubiquitin-protein ligase RNF14-like [Protopterus annectens]|uniref:E3 ubiquitin-protein ligase RNF14-like n=1 Tax=Protopterus annectens TaxID=7888 RepID=UPI001CFBBE8D|nr:E3 ubiquitin-protein ligase RNF14-like [Protopterus annectens]